MSQLYFLNGIGVAPIGRPAASAAPCLPRLWLARSSECEGRVHLPDQPPGRLAGGEAALPRCGETGGVPRFELAFRLEVQPPAGKVHVSERRIRNSDHL